MNNNLEELVQIYLTIRTEREKLELAWKANDAVFRQELQVLEQALLVACNETNVNGFRTDSGTVIRKLNERYTTSDWDNFKKFVLEHEAIDLLERRIHQGNFKEFIARREGEGLPPGVNVMREYGITVRKPSN